MNSVEIPPGSPLWLITLAVLTPMLLTFIKGMKNLSGPIGWLARRWDSRQVRAVDRMTQLDTVLEKAVDRRVEFQLKPLRDRIDGLKRDLDEERKAREYGERENSLLRQYSIAAARREFVVEQFAAKHGFELPPPPLPSFDDWVREREATEGIE